MMYAILSLSCENFTWFTTERTTGNQVPRVDQSDCISYALKHYRSSSGSPAFAHKHYTTISDCSFLSPCAGVYIPSVGSSLIESTAIINLPLPVPLMRTWWGYFQNGSCFFCTQIKRYYNECIVEQNQQFYIISSVFYVAWKLNSSRYIHKKKERKRERKQDFKRATINIQGLLGTSKTRELMHEGGEMSTTDGTGGIKVIKWYQK